MDQLKPPGHLCLEGNLAENWRKWKQRFNLFLIASGIGEKSKQVQSSTLLHVIGEDALEIYNTFEFASDDQKEDPVKIMEKFQGYCNPRKNLTWERHKFFTRNQEASESFDQYVTELRNKAKHCEFGELKDSLIKDKIICGIRDDSVRARLLRVEDLTLTKTITICRASEMSAEQMKKMTEETSDKLSVHKLNKRLTNVKGATADVKGATGHYKAGKPKNTVNYIANCTRCGTSHAKNKCAAYGKPCHNCGKLNHFAKFCRSQLTSKPGRPRRVHAVREDDLETDDETELFIGSIHTVSDCSRESKDWNVNLKLGERYIKFKVDTGAQCNVLQRSDFDKLKTLSLEQSNVKLVTYDGSKLEVCGKSTALCELNNKQYSLEFQIMDKNVPNVIGLQTCKVLGLIPEIHTINSSNDELFNKYPSVFTGLGCLKDEHHITVDPSVPPVVHPPRKVPVVLRAKIKRELDRMEKQEVIEKVHGPSDWVNSMVTVIKPNKIRICLDPKHLNEAIKREHHPMPTIEDVVSRMPGAKVFTKLDASSGFWQLKLDEESTKLCTFNTPFGRYRFKRLPFGVKCAPEMFQKAMTQLFEGIEGTECIMDDILVWGDSEEQHDKRLERVLQRAQQANLKLNRDKCRSKTTEVTYIGHVLSANGLKVDPNKVEAVQKMERPNDKASLQRFLGMITYLSKFIPHLSSTSAPLRDLLVHDTEWHWTEHQERSFKELKNAVTTAPVLKYFDVTAPVQLSVDASSKGLGAVLMQNDQPVAYASRALTETQQCYAQIEKELLAIVFGCERFHEYIYGQSTVLVESDHKPLETIFTKPLHQNPIRLQKMLMKLQKYNLSVRFKPGRLLYIADTLSRAYLQETGDILDDELTVNMINMLPITESKMEELKRATQDDKALQLLKATVQKGWPSDRKAVNSDIRQYWHYRAEISVYDDILYRGEKVLIPAPLRKEMLAKIHESHLGIEKCKRRARDILFCPGMNSQIEETVSKCSICNEMRHRNQREPLISHPVPERPWAKVGADLFEIDGSDYLLVVDYYSGFFEIAKLYSTKSSSVITQCKSLFARYGIPDELISDNGPQFSSREFAKFASTYNFKHTTSSPKYPQSNGMVEKAVQTAKRLLIKSKRDGKDPYLALLDYRNTPRDDALGSPVQRLMGRRTKTNLPTCGKLLEPKLIKPETVKFNLSKRKLHQKHYYDRNSKSLSELKQGDCVRFQNGKYTQPAVVYRKLKEPRSYVINAGGTKYRRNRRDLINIPKSTRGEFDVDAESDIEFDQISSPQPGPDLQETPTASQTVTRTSRGRIIRPPLRFKDYVCY